MELIEKIILGRTKRDFEKYGDEGSIFIGKKYMKLSANYFLTNPIYLDVIKPHVILICGKRGSGKSYTAGVMAEAMATIEDKVAKNISTVIFDTMGIYWTTKYPNYDQKDLLKEWNLEPKGFEDKVNTFVPLGLYDEAKSYGIKPDYPLKIRLSEISGDEWIKLMQLPTHSDVAAYVERLIEKLRNDVGNYDFDDIYSKIEKDNIPLRIKWIVENRFKFFENLGIFYKDGLKVNDIVIPGKINVLDISYYVNLPGGNEVRAIIISIISRQIFGERIKVRKKEEIETIEYTKKGYVKIEKKKFPIAWIIIDEVHEFLPRKGKTLATDILVQILREGRQPGIANIMITQQPGKVHTDVITQSDIIISHLLTAKVDIDALNNAMQSYLSSSIKELMVTLPKNKGSALVLDDKQEKVYQIQIRPRITWHGGGEPKAL